jgi:hypothetical protein
MRFIHHHDFQANYASRPISGCHNVRPDPVRLLRYIATNDPDPAIRKQADALANAYTYRALEAIKRGDHLKK